MNKSIKKLETPCVLVDENKLKHNIGKMQKKANFADVFLRPHIKTHKNLYIAAMQMNAGATGITASKISEAMLFLKAGFPSITIAYPIVDVSKMLRLLKAPKTHLTDLYLICDSKECFQTILEGTDEVGYPVSVYIKIDVGLNRCGFKPNDAMILKLASEIKAAKRMYFKGLLSHAGHVYAATNRLEVRQIAREQVLILHSVKNKLSQAGIVVERISIGATPSLISSPKIGGVSEIRPGNYVFLDRTPLHQDLIERSEIALSILGTVISENEGFYIIDTGSKVLSSDIGAHGTNAFSGYGLVYPLKEFADIKSEFVIEKLSEEHGFVKKRNEYLLKIGEKIRILPNHACAVMNLANHFYLVNEKRVVKELTVDARGKVI